MYEEVGCVVYLWELAILSHEGESVMDERVEDSDEDPYAQVCRYGQQETCHWDALHKNIPEQSAKSTQLSHRKH